MCCLLLQIDGSTLKTLCMQHGPLINFHLALNQGFALVNYGSREEASKVSSPIGHCIRSPIGSCAVSHWLLCSLFLFLLIFIFFSYWYITNSKSQYARIKFKNSYSYKLMRKMSAYKKYIFYIKSVQLKIRGKPS